MKTFLTCLCLFVITGFSAAQNKADIDAVNKVLDKYSETEVAGDMIAQAKLMTDERVLPQCPMSLTNKILIVKFVLLITEESNPTT